MNVTTFFFLLLLFIKNLCVNSNPSSQGYNQNDTPTAEGKNIKPKSIQDQRNAHVSIISLLYLKRLQSVANDKLKLYYLYFLQKC